VPGTVEFMIGGRLWASLPLVVESGLSRPGAIRFAALIRRPTSMHGAYATRRRRVSGSIPDMPGLGPDLDLAATRQGLGLTIRDWPPRARRRRCHPHRLGICARAGATLNLRPGEHEARLSVEPSVGRVERWHHDVRDRHPPRRPVPHRRRDQHGAARENDRILRSARWPSLWPAVTYRSDSLARRLISSGLTPRYGRMTTGTRFLLVGPR
jgi:hypothetical protein